MAHTVAKGFSHKQTTAATTWTIKHGAVNGSKVAVEVFIDVLGERVKAIPKSVAMTSDTVTVTFSTAQTGEAYVI